MGRLALAAGHFACTGAMCGRASAAMATIPTESQNETSPGAEVRTSGLATGPVTAAYTLAALRTSKPCILTRSSLPTSTLPEPASLLRSTDVRWRGGGSLAPLAWLRRSGH